MELPLMELTNQYDPVRTSQKLQKEKKMQGETQKNILKNTMPYCDGTHLTRFPLRRAGLLDINL